MAQTHRELPDEAYLVALASLEAIAPRHICSLVGSLGARGAHEALARPTGGDATTAALGRLSRSRDLRLVARWRRQAAESDPAELLAAHRRAGLGVAAPGGPCWPAEAFESLAEPPAVLVFAGDPDVLAGARVAVVGTRRATAEGLATARCLGGELASAGVSVASGLAAGIDAAAHQGALAARAAPVVGVVAGGPDVVSPRPNSRLWSLVGTRGLLVSEWPLGARPLGWRFAARNRIIAAFGDVTVVVQSHRRGGTLITARAAAAAGREVMAVPGSTGEPASQGCLDLLADGAQICRGADDVLMALSRSPGSSRPAAEHRPDPGPGGRLVLDALGWLPARAGWLARRTGTDPARLAEVLGSLAAAGWISCAGGWVRRVARFATT